MEDFVAGFEETADRYASAADWIEHHLDALPFAGCYGHAPRLVAILAKQPIRADGAHLSLGRSSRG